MITYIMTRQFHRSRYRHDGRFIFRAYRNGIRCPELDYWTDDRIDAKIFAQFGNEYRGNKRISKVLRQHVDFQDFPDMLRVTTRKTDWKTLSLKLAKIPAREFDGE